MQPRGKYFEAVIRYFSLKQLAQLILHISGLASKKLNSKSFLVKSKSQPSIFAFSSLSETTHTIERKALNTSHCDEESETNQMAVPRHACRARAFLQFLSGAGTRLAECGTADSHPFWAVVPNFIPRHSGFQILES